MKEKKKQQSPNLFQILEKLPKPLQYIVYGILGLVGLRIAWAFLKALW